MKLALVFLAAVVAIAAAAPAERANDRKVLVSGLPATITKVQLENEFGRVGQLEDTQLLELVNIGIITYAHQEGADRAVNELHGTRPFGGDEDISVEHNGIVRIG